MEDTLEDSLFITKKVCSGFGSLADNFLLFRAPPKISVAAER